MSMFDYDTRRITPQVVLVGTVHLLPDTPFVTS
jgi:hypothetical protein